MGQQQEQRGPVRLLPSAMHQLVRSMLNVTGTAEACSSTSSSSMALDKGTASTNTAAGWAHHEERWRATGRRKLEEFVQHKLQLGIVAESEVLWPQPQLPAEHGICTCCVRCAARRLRYTGSSCGADGCTRTADGLAQLTSWPDSNLHQADVIVHLTTAQSADASRHPQNPSHLSSKPLLLNRAYSASGPLPSQHASPSLSPLSCQHELLRRLMPTASLSRADAREALQELKLASPRAAGQQCGTEGTHSPAVHTAVTRGADAAGQSAAGRVAADAEAGVSEAMASDPLVDLLLEQITELMKEKSELQTQVCWLLAENSAMQELIGFLAENQREEEAEELLQEQYAPSELQELRRLVSREPLLVQT